MSYTAENFIEFIEWNRNDKISPNGLKLIAEKFREQQQQLKKLNIPDVSKQSELLFDFYKWQRENGCLYSDATQEYKMKSDIEEFIKSKL